MTPSRCIMPSCTTIKTTISSLIRIPRRHIDPLTTITNCKYKFHHHSSNSRFTTIPRAHHLANPIATTPPPVPPRPVPPTLQRQHHRQFSTSPFTPGKYSKYTYTDFDEMSSRGSRGKGRGGGGSGRGGGQSEDVAISKALSFILRHGAIKEGLPMRPDGYANVQDLVSSPS